MARGVYWTLVYNRIPALMVAVEAASRSAPKEVAENIRTTARRLCPVDTGALKASIQAVSVETGKTAEVVVGEEYGKFVEFGTYKMAAQPFLYPAFEKHAKELQAKMVVPFK